MRTELRAVSSEGRALSLRARVVLCVAALAALTLAACQQDASPDPFIGPSELGLSLALSASPDVLPLDGASQSLVTILARDGAGHPVANVTLRLQLRFGGVFQDVGGLSARTLVTAPDGRALATYTAPLGGSIDEQAQVEILVTPVGDDYAGAVTRSLTIRLVPSGIVIPPFVAEVRGNPLSVDPATPTELSPAIFSLNLCSTDPVDTDCVSDPADQLFSFLWDFGDGNLDSGLSAEHTYASSGSYIVAVTASDAFDRSVSTSATVTVNAIDLPTPDFTVSPGGPRVGEPVFFTATSTSPVPIVSSDWDFGDGATASGGNVAHTFSAAGAYTVILTVTDQLGRQATTSKTVTVSSSRPTASFVFSPSSPTTTTTVQFNAAASLATSGRTITSYAWNFGDGATTSGVTTSHSFTVEGVYSVVLTVTDSAGESGTTSENVTVTTVSGGAPTASFTFSPTNPTTAQDVSFNAAASTDPSGTITAYGWNFGDGLPGDGSIATGVTAAHRFASAGVFNVSLTVTSSTGATATITLSVTVTSGTSSGVTTASFTVSPSPTPLGTATIVDAAASTASTGETISTYLWNFGDSTVTFACPGAAGCNGPIFAHTYSNAGDFTITLTVTDSGSLTDTASVGITVESAPAETVTASFTSVLAAAGSPSTFTSTSASTPAGLGLTFTWDFGDNNSTTTAANPTAHTYAVAGSYVVQLTATTPGGVSDTVSATVVIP